MNSSSINSNIAPTFSDNSSSTQNKTLGSKKCDDGASHDEIKKHLKANDQSIKLRNMFHQMSHIPEATKAQNVKKINDAHIKNSK